MVDRSFPKKRASVSMRMYKFMSSKTIETKIGRRTMVQSLGVAESNLCNVISAIVSEVVEESEANEMSKAFLKLIIKTRAVLRYESSAFSHSDSVDIAGPVYRFCFEFLYLIKAIPKMKEKDDVLELKKEDVEYLVATMEDCFQEWDRLMTPHMTDKNINMMKSFFRFAENSEVVYSILCNKNFKEPSLRNELVKQIYTVLESFEILQGYPHLYCSELYCGKPALPSYGLFEGSIFCTKHHAEYYDRLIEHPSIQYFVKSKVHHECFLRYLEESGDFSEKGREIHRLNFQLLEHIFEFEETRSKRLKQEELYEIVELIDKIVKSKGVEAVIDIPIAAYEKTKECAQSILKEDQNLRQNMFEGLDFKKTLHASLQTLCDSKLKQSKGFMLFICRVKPNKRSIEESQHFKDLQRSTVFF